MGAKKINYYVPGKNRRRRKHYWWRYLLVFILGQALVLPEFVLTLGTAASSIEVGTVLDLAGAKEYVGEEYYNDTVLTMVMKITTTPEKLQTFGGLASISPALDKVYADYIDKYSKDYGIELDKDEFYALNFAEFPNYLKDKVMGVQLAEVLKKLNVNLDGVPVLPELLYETDEETGEKTARSIQQIMDMIKGDDGIMGVLKSVKLEVIPGIDDIPLLGSFKDKSFGDLMDPDFMESIKLSALIGENNENPLMKMLEDKSINDLTSGTFLDDVTIGGALGIDDDATGIMAALKDCKLSAESIEEGLNDLKLGDVLGEDQLAGTMLENFKDKKVMELGDVLEDTYLYEILKTRTYLDEGDTSEVGPNGEEIKVEDETNKRYYIASSVESIMKLLCETKPEGSDHLIKLSELSEKMNDVIQSATIEDILGPQEEGSLIALFSDCHMNDIGDRIEELKISEIMGDKVNDSPFLQAIADFYLMNVPEGTDGKTISQGIESLTLRDIMGNDNLGIYKLAETITTQTAFDEFSGDLFTKEGEVYTKADSFAAGTDYYSFEFSSPVLGLMADKYLYGDDNTILTVLDELTIGQAMGIDKNDTSVNAVLRAMADVKVVGGDVIGAVQTCKVKDIIGEDAMATNPLLATLGESTLDSDSISDAINNLKLVDFVGKEEMFDDPTTPTKVKGIWSLMFTDGAHKFTFKTEEEYNNAVAAYTNLFTDNGLSTPATGYVDENTEYFANLTAIQAAELATVNDMGSLISGLTTTIMSKTLFELQEVGIIASTTELDKDLNPLPTEELILGNLTIQGLIDFVSNGI